MKRKKRRQQQTIAALQARWGARVIRPLRELPAARPVLATNLPALDRALGGGLPRGRISQWTARPSAGITTLAYQVVGAAQAAQLPVYYLDPEGTFDPDYAGRLNVRLDQVLLIHPRRPAQMEDILHDLALAPEAGLVVADLPPSTWHDSLPQALSRLRAPLAQADSILLCLTLLPPTPGAVAPQLPAALHLHGRRRRWLYHGRDIAGVRLEVTVQQNQGGPAGHTVSLDITWPPTPDTP